MKRSIFKFVMIMLIITIPRCILATPPFTVGEAVVTGNGCPSGSYNVILSADRSELTILYSEFTAMTDETHSHDFSNCNIAIPIDLSSGIMVGLVGVDYRGIAFIPSGGTGTFSREHFFAGTHSPPSTSSITEHDQFQEFLFEDDFPVVAWTECGDDTIVRSNATIMVTNSPTSTNKAFMSVSSERWNISMLFHLVWKYC
ncbi:MAG: DUF4360 domain-containing protein [Chitinivibrionales bacterium]|nr:DUF4360 domain-containing protein [Chitinivibrionales bacterium]